MRSGAVMKTDPLVAFFDELDRTGRPDGPSPIRERGLTRLVLPGSLPD